MAELATIARPYAEALFKVAGQGELDSTSAWLDELAAIAADARLREYASNPNVSEEQVYGLIASVQKAPLNDAARNFLRAIIANGRVAALPEIADQFRVLKNARSGTADAVIESAFPIDGAALGDVLAALQKRFGRKLHASVQVVPELIGGIRVVVGDEVLDTSVRARLEQMKVALTA